MPSTNDVKAPRELLALAVGEVSLVDAAANQRRFLITKRLEPTMPASPAPTANVHVVKAGELLTSLSKERLALITEKVATLMSGIGTMDKDAVRDTMSSIYSSLYSVEGDLVALSKQLEGGGLVEQGMVKALLADVRKAKKDKVTKGVCPECGATVADGEATCPDCGAEMTMAKEAKKAGDTEEEVAKAKRMTPSRIAKLQGTIDGLTALLKEFSTEVADDSGEESVAEAVTKAVSPLTAELATKTQEVEAQKALVATKDTELAKAKEAHTAELNTQKALVTSQAAELVELRKQVAALQAAPKGGSGDGEPNVAVKKSVFAGVV